MQTCTYRTCCPRIDADWAAEPQSSCRSLQCFDELIRQVTVNCAERGLLILRVRDEMRMVGKLYSGSTGQYDFRSVPTDQKSVLLASCKRRTSLVQFRLCLQQTMVESLGQHLLGHFRFCQTQTAEKPQNPTQNLEFTPCFGCTDDRSIPDSVRE